MPELKIRQLFLMKYQGMPKKAHANWSILNPLLTIPENPTDYTYWLILMPPNELKDAFDEGYQMSNPEESAPYIVSATEGLTATQVLINYIRELRKLLNIP